MDLSYPQFSVHLARLGWGEQVPADCAALYLCAACCSGSARAYQAIEATYFPVLRRTLARRYSRSDFVEDVLQQARERLFVGPSARIRGYLGKGNFTAWLQQVTNRIALDNFRKPGDRVTLQLIEFDGWSGCRDAHQVLESASSELLDPRWIECVQRALTEAVCSLGTADRQLLRLHYDQQVRVEDIATCLQIDRSTAYRRLTEAVRRVQRSTLSLIQARLGIRDEGELAHLLSASLSQIHLDAAIWEDVGDGAKGRAYNPASPGHATGPQLV